MAGSLDIVRVLRIGAPAHSVSLCADASRLLVGTDGALTLYTRHGDAPFRYADRNGDLSFRLVRLAPDLSGGLAVQRSGEILALTMHGRRAEQTVEVRQLRWEANDIYSVSWDTAGERIALGHYGPALSVLNNDGSVQWRRHPQDGNATNGRLWSVALSRDGDQLYVGAAAGSANLLAALSAAGGVIGARTQVAAHITHLAALADPLAVAALLNTPEASRVAAFDAGLQAPRWEYLADDGEVFTCLESAPGAGLVVAGSSTGAIRVLNAFTGELLAPPCVTESAVLSLTAAADNTHIAAGLTDGRAVLMAYAPPVRDEEILDL